VADSRQQQGGVHPGIVGGAELGAETP
jgi:hypothetical protein